MDFNNGSFYLDPCVKYIIESSQKLHCSTATRTKALLLYHLFNQDHDANEYETTTSAACLNLSIKFYNEDIELDAVIFALYSIKGQPLTSTKDKRLNSMRNALAAREQLILKKIGFKLDTHIAHDYLVFYLNDFREIMVHMHVWDVLAEVTMKLACDFYLSDKCFNYKAEDIAVGILKSAFYLIGIKVTTDSYLLNWFKALNNVPESTLENITDEICRVCSTTVGTEMAIKLSTKS